MPLLTPKDGQALSSQHSRKRIVPGLIPPSAWAHKIVPMAACKDVEAALRLAGDFDRNELYPASFPEDVPIISLQKISLCKLLNGDVAEAERMFKICNTVGFFYLDMLDHALGRQTWEHACHIHRLGKERLRDTPMEEKRHYNALGGVSVFDRG